MNLLPDDWSKAFELQTPLLELFARGTVLYLGILVLMRFMPRRSGGELATMDLIFALLIADAAAHGLGDYTSVADGLILIVILMSWNYLVNVLSYRVPLLERFTSAPPLQIIRDGQLLRRNMRREFLTEEELMSYLRLQGVDDVNDVKSAFVEGEGKISVVQRGPRRKSGR